MKLLGSKVEPVRNLKHSVQRYRVWWVILLVSIVFDYLTTLNFVSKVGVRAEANLVIAWLIDNLGLYAGLATGKLLQLLAVVVFVCLQLRLGNLFLLVVILLNCWAVVMNSVPHYY